MAGKSKELKCVFVNVNAIYKKYFGKYVFLGQIARGRFGVSL